MSLIDDHFGRLRASGLDLGAPRAPETSAGFGGRVREYALGNIYFHPVMGDRAKEVHGAILASYLENGGPGFNPAAPSRRDFGFPLTDETFTPDGIFPVSYFEFGVIHSKHAAAPIVGDFFTQWKRVGAELGKLGYPISGIGPVAGGEAVYFEGGCLWRGPTSNGQLIQMNIFPPQMGQPALVDLTGDGLGARFRLSFDSSLAVPNSIMTASVDLFGALWNGRLILRSVQGFPTVGPAAPPEVVGVTPQPHGPGAGVLPPPAFVLGGAGHALGGGGSFKMRHEVSLAARRLTEGQEVFSADNLKGVVEVPPPPTPTAAGNRRLRDRALYDVIFIAPNRVSEIPLASHAVYAKSSWDSFHAAHATDLHVSRRSDILRQRLVELNFPEGARQFNSFNDAFRDFIRHANALHEQGKLDVIIATGDLVDYVYENTDVRGGPGNFGVFEDLVLGRSPYPPRESAVPAAQELRVPIFTALGNHDYRANAYPLIFELTFASVGISTIQQHESANLTLQEGVALAGGRWQPVPGPIGVPPALVLIVPQFDREDASRFAALDQPMVARTSYYFRRINRDPTYIVKLDQHRIVMLDSGPDVGIVTGFFEGFWAALGNGPEDKRTFVGGGPNSEGVNAFELELVRAALAQAGANGLVMVGIHAPLINIKDNEYDYYLRETEHPTADENEVLGMLFRCDPVPFALSAAEIHPNWPRTGTAHFKQGSISDLLDDGVSRGEVETLMRMCTGTPTGRPVDLVLFGHVHRNVEYRARLDGANMLYFHDYYTANPVEYYAQRAIEDGDFRSSRRVHVIVDAPFEPRDETIRVIDGSGPFNEEWRRAVAINQQTLEAQGGDVGAATQWWRQRRPLLMQTAALGPIDQNQRLGKSLRPDASPPARFDRPSPSFQGFRLLKVQSNVITRMQYVKLADVRSGAVTAATI